LLRDELLGTTEATWSKALGVWATLTGKTWGTLEAVLEAKERLLVDSFDDNWSRLILAGSFENTKNKDHSDQGENTDESISVGTVKVVHL
jgi:hypothetical protein|tara:strand:+ start:47 stop:316 length:270 start_codon:yes stop_codon:yes gene_type:complete